MHLSELLPSSTSLMRSNSVLLNLLSISALYEVPNISLTAIKSASERESTNLLGVN